MKRVAFKADIEKMYRQIELAQSDQQYHTILWRDDPSKPLKEYQMTFGTAAAPYLATRTLKRIGQDGSEKYPIGAQKVMDDFFVDDMLSGEDTIEKALIAKNELRYLLEDAGMKLRKWTSNDQEFLNTLPVEETEKSLQLFENNESSKTLGLQWSPRTDMFSFKISWNNIEGKLTKRKLLSTASKLFDPLGWLAPVVVKAKLFMQEVWLEKLDWDDEVPEKIKINWLNYQDELVTLGEIEIPRWIELSNINEMTLHGFCDGSEVAYSAAVYARVVEHEKIMIYLLAAKTRVAPKATKTTIPRLELCGAVLLTNLIKQVKKALKEEKVKAYAWSDSMVALGWIKANPGRWKTFVANRVAEIQSKNEIDEWNYVKSEENPADCASRGIMPSDLKRHKLWWSGPDWLKDDPANWKKAPILEHNWEQRREVSANMTLIENKITTRFSSWIRLVRVTAWLKRWINKRKGPLLTEELKEATQLLLKQCQSQSFGEEIRSLRKNKIVKKASKILNLNPILGADGLLRVGGRLGQSELPYESKHPIILPADHHLTKLIIQSIHEETAHGGPQLMTTVLRKKYWVIRGKRAVNNIYKKCVICKRQAGKVCSQLMGDLPEDRVKLSSRAFLHTGVDYTGAVEVRSSKLRKASIEVGYIALFICFATKAVHLELVSDQTSDAFLAALQRFIARRGLCTDMYSDNGKNFVGATTKLERDLFLVRNQELANYVAHN